MTIAQTIKIAAAKLNAKNISIPHLEAEILLSEILKKPREFLLARGEKKLSAKQISDFKHQLARRLKGEPIAYIIGKKEFYGLDFKVNRHVLIPRPETELMVDEALKLISHSLKPVTLVDAGAGSGCVAITLSKLTKQNIIAIDISGKALAVAKQNAKRHGVEKKIKFIKGNLLSPIIHDPSFIAHNPLIILANLPYLDKDQIKSSPSIKYEPETALFGGKNGLELYEKLFQQITGLSDITMLCEFDPRKTVRIKQLIKKHLPLAKLQIKKDLAGLNRLAVIRINQNLEP
ncbi:MAG: peptide chain release factor N(5)-glutamine methyltransferase [bacterium]